MRLFWRRSKDSDGGSELESAQRELDEIAAQIAVNSDKAFRRLRKLVSRHRSLFEEGGLLRGPFVEVSLALLAPGRGISDLPAFRRCSVRDFAELRRAAEACTEDLLWISHPRPDKDGDPLDELDARSQFVKDNQLVLVFIGDVPPFVVKCDFLLAVAAEFEPTDQLEDLPQGLLEAAERKGLRAFNL